MGKMVLTIVKQIREWTRIINLHPYLIAFFQVERRLECHRTILINGVVTLVNKTRPDYIPVQIKTRKKINPKRRRFKNPNCCEWEKINSRSRGREYPRCQIHGVSLVHQRHIERKRSCCFVKIIISLDVEIDGCRFDVGVSDPFLETFS